MEPKITPLSEPLNSFPHFMPNQVLTHTQLNELAVYLEQQDRFTRQRLIGIGIVCGLQANLTGASNNYTIEISRGVGVTSCGFLIDVPLNLTFTKRKEYTTPADYLPFLQGAAPGTPITCLELKPAASTEIGVTSLSNTDIANKVVVLFLDLEDKPNGKCIGENCDEKGNKWLFNLRVLLIDIVKMEGVLKKTYIPNPFSNPLNTSTQREEFFNPEYLLPSVFIERFGNSNNNPNTDFNLSSLTTFSDFEDSYRSIITKGSVRIANAIHETYRLFKPVFDTQLLISSNPFSGFENPEATNTLTKQLKDLTDKNDSDYKKGNCQYVYDFLRDLMATYNELREELFTLASECSPDPSRFPRHLMIGILKATDFGKFVPEDYATPSLYRQFFSSSPVLNHQSQHLKKAKVLIQRLDLQLDTLNFSNILENSIQKEPIRITPDKTCCSLLGEQRVPFYYNIEGSKALMPYWNFQYTVQNRVLENRSYFMDQYVPSGLSADVKAKLKYPILFDLCGFPKLSIEGHVGKDLETAVNDLKTLRKRHNLSFDILALKLDKTFNEIALADDNLIADLQLKYSVERNELVCCLQDLADYIEENRASILIFLWLIFYVLYDDPNDIPPALQTYIANLLDAYHQSIELMIEALPADIKEFNFLNLHAIFPAFTSFTAVFKYGINTWGDIEFFLQNREQAGTFKWALSDIISVILNLWELYLDKVGDDCTLGKFYTIYSALYYRLESFSLFHKFNESIHGMEHIAGTSKGGTFILVYDDEEDKVQVSGQAIDNGGKAIEGVYIVDADNESIVYGMTDSKGFYNVHIPSTQPNIRLVKPGHVRVDVKAQSKGKKNVRGAKDTRDFKVKMATYCDAAAGKKTDASKLSGAEKVYVNIKSAYDGILATDKRFAKAEAFLNLDMVYAQAAPFVIQHKKSFRVVADFYLPHLIHNVKTVQQPIDACEELREVKMIDFTVISKALSKEVNIGKPNASFKTFFNAKAKQ